MARVGDQPVRDVRGRRGVFQDGLAKIQSRGRQAVAAGQVAVGVGDLSPRGAQAQPAVADVAADHQPVADLSACAAHHPPCRNPAERGQAGREGARGGHGVAPHQSDPGVLQVAAETRRKRGAFRLTKPRRPHHRQKGREGLGALGRQVGEIDPRQPPADQPGIFSRQEVDPLDDGVLGDHQIEAGTLGHDGGVVQQVERARRPSGQRPEQPGDFAEFIQRGHPWPRHPERR